MGLGRWTVSAGAVAVAAITANDTLRTRVVTVPITSRRIDPNRPLRVLQITDVHDLPRRYQRRSIVGAVAANQPDLIVLTGDLVSLFTKRFDRMHGFVRELVATGVPVFYVWGNHERANSRFTADVVTDAGATVLVNQWMSLDGPWGTVDLIGTDDYDSGLGNLAKAMQGTRPGAFSLVLSHSPERVIQRDLPTQQPDLMLSGHTHGGQIRIPFYGAVFLSNQTRQGLQWDRGIFHFGATAVYIDQGVGGSFPLRFLAPSQISLVEIAHPSPATLDP